MGNDIKEKPPEGVIIWWPSEYEVSFSKVSGWVERFLTGISFFLEKSTFIHVLREYSFFLKMLYIFTYLYVVMTDQDLQLISKIKTFFSDDNNAKMLLTSEIYEKIKKTKQDFLECGLPMPPFHGMCYACCIMFIKNCDHPEDFEIYEAKADIQFTSTKRGLTLKNFPHCWLVNKKEKDIIDMAAEQFFGMNYPYDQGQPLIIPPEQ